MSIFIPVSMMSDGFQVRGLRAAGCASKGGHDRRSNSVKPLFTNVNGRAHLVNKGSPSSQTLARVSSDALLDKLAPCIPSEASARVATPAIADHRLAMGTVLFPLLVYDSRTPGKERGGVSTQVRQVC